MKAKPLMHYLPPFALLAGVSLLFSCSTPARKIAGLDRTPAQLKPAVCRELMMPGHQYPFGIDIKKNGNDFYTYGYEIEYSIDEMEGGLFTFYAPTTDLMPRDSWTRMSLEEKKKWIKSHQNDLFPLGTRKEGKLELVVEDERMPRRLIMDETGNIEIVSPKVFDDYVSFTAYLNYLGKKFGPGYVQSSIGVSSKAVFQSEKLTESFAGARFFLNEKDTLKKLKDAYSKYLENPKYIPAKSFYHQSLGPLNHVRADFFRKILEKNQEGLFPNDVLNRIAGMDISYKYHSGVVYRPDIVRGGNVFVVEIRDCVKNFDCLTQRLLREKFLFSQDFSLFQRFYKASHLDTIVDFNMMDDDVQRILIEAFPQKGEHIQADEHLAAELFRNFAYPIQDWYSWISNLGLPPERVSIVYQTVENAKAEYTQTLKSLARSRKDAVITREQAQDAVRIALAKFAHESGLSDLFEDFLNKNLPGYSEMELFF